MIPVLETERLTLRECRLEDFPAHSGMWADSRTRRFFPTPFSEEDAWVRFLRNFGQWQMFGYGNWGVEEKASGNYIGAVGFFQAKRAMALPYRDAPEAGWVIAPDYHRRGYAREALRHALAWADVHVEAPQSWCMIDPGNDISRKIAMGAGYVQALLSEYKGQAVQTYLRPRGAA